MSLSGNAEPFMYYVSSGSCLILMEFLCLFGLLYCSSVFTELQFLLRIDHVFLCFEFQECFLSLSHLPHLCACCLSVTSLLIAFLHFISFHVNIWPNVQRDCFVEGFIRWESKSICQVMFDRLITGGSIKKRSELRWLTRQLKPLCRDLGSRPSIRLLFLSRGLLKSSIIRNFILFLNVGYVLFCKPQKWSEFGQNRL